MVVFNIFDGHPRPFYIGEFPRNYKNIDPPEAHKAATNITVYKLFVFQLSIPLANSVIRKFQTSRVPAGNRGSLKLHI